MATPYELVIFDCDGTLVDSETLNNAATIALIRDQGIDGYDMDYAMAHFVGVSFINNIRAIETAENVKFPDNITDLYIQKIRELTPDMMRTIPHAADAVSMCARMAKICVASNGERANVLDALHASGLAPLFDPAHIFTFEQVARPKPAPDLFLFAAEQMGVSPDQCLVIEDSIFGARAGVAAGMDVIGFTGAAHDAQAQAAALSEERVIGVVHDLLDIAPYLLD